MIMRLPLLAGISALALLLGCPPVDPPLDDGGPKVDAGNVPDAGNPPVDGGNPPDDGGPYDAGPGGDCGNGEVEPGEECDDGNNSNTDGCTNYCYYAVCGDDYVYAGNEECDDGNTTDGDGCSATCEYEDIVDTVTLSGYIYNRKYTNQQAAENVTTVAQQVYCNDATCVTDPAYTGVNGAYSIAYLPPQSVFRLEMRTRDGYEDPYEPGGYAVRVKTATKNEPTETYNAYFTPHSWLSEVAVACGIYEEGNYEAGTYPNRVNGNPQWSQYAAFMGQLKDENGDGVGGVTKSRIQVELAGYENANPDYVCFLNVDGDNLVGSQSDVSYAAAGGAFIYFKARNDAGVGLGNGYVRVAYQAGQANFQEQSVAVQAGMLGQVTLYTDDDPNPVPLDTVYFDEVVQILQTQGCVGCHYEGGAGDVQSGGYYARFKLVENTPEEVQEIYDNLVGPGTNCDVDNYVGNYRVCLNDPAASRLLQMPLYEDPPNHPNASFSDTNDPEYQTLYAWLEQGAQYEAPPVGNVYTLYGVMHTATQVGCTACHAYNDPNGAPPAGGLPLNGCYDGYNDAYADNGVDYNPDTNPNYNRDCVYYHLKNQGVDDDPYEYGYRVNPDYPERSMLLRNPYCGPYYCAEDQYPETHPVQVLPNAADANYLNILSWIADGAPNNGDADTLYLTP